MNIALGSVFIFQQFYRSLDKRIGKFQDFFFFNVNSTSVANALENFVNFSISQN
jgi:hypothetical protein